MKLIFWGTSHGVPQPDRFCSAALLQCAGGVYLLDGGAPVADLMVRGGIPFSQLRAVFATHMHSDHTFGIPHLCSLANWYFVDASFDVYLPEQAGVEAFRAVLLAGDKQLCDRRIRLKTAQAGVIYDDGCLAVTAIPTGHMGEQYPSFAYMLEGEGRRIFLTGDLRPDASDFPAAAKQLKSDAVICELAHFGPEQIRPHVEACPTKRLIFHHVCGMEAAVAAVNAWQNTLPFPIYFAADGAQYLL